MGSDELHITEETERRFEAFLKSKRLRKTQERFAILRKCLGYTGHFEADGLHGDLESDGYHVSRATVYNTLELLTQCGILTRLLFDPHQARYERADRNHCHLVCTQCGRIREIDDKEVTGRLSNMRLSTFTPQTMSICIYGICAACQRRNRRKTKK